MLSIQSKYCDIWFDIVTYDLTSWFISIQDKGGFFFQKMRFVFQISKKSIFQKNILSLKFKFPVNNSILQLAGNLNLKLWIVFWNIFILEIWRFEKRIAFSEKKPLLTFHSNSCHLFKWIYKLHQQIFWPTHPQCQQIMAQ